jgi:polyisoprenoid-binding protein YceI
MRRVLPVAAPFVIGFALSAAQPVHKHRYELDPAVSKVWFDADATMGAFRGRSSTLTGWLETEDPGYSNVRAHVELAAATLKTGVGMRDGHMRETLDTNKYPIISIDLDSTRQDSTNAHHIWARLRVREDTLAFDTDVRVQERGDTIFVSGRFPVRFTDLGMKPPTRMLGTMKVKNDFSIGFECAFHRNE